MFARLKNLLGIGSKSVADSRLEARSGVQRDRRSGRDASVSGGKPPSREPSPPTEQQAAAPLIKNRLVREDTGTHETLTILDDSLVDSGEEPGFDPYNTGDFDRSKNWERRFRS